MHAALYLRAALRLIGEEQQAKPLPQWWQELVQQYEGNYGAKSLLRWFENDYGHLINKKRFVRVFNQHKDRVHLNALLELAANDPSNDLKYYEWMVRLYESYVGDPSKYDEATVNRIIEAVLDYERWIDAIDTSVGEPEEGQPGVRDYLNYFPTLEKLETHLRAAPGARVPARRLKRDIQRELVYPRPTKEELRGAILYRAKSYDALCKIAPKLAVCVPSSLEPQRTWNEILGSAGNSIYVVASRDKRYIYLIRVGGNGNIKAIYDSNNIQVYPSEDVYRYLVEILEKAGVGRGVTQRVPGRYVFPGYVVYRIDNHAALCDIGSDTRWCSSDWSTPDYWEENLALFGGNTVYVVVTDDELHKYIVRVGRSDNGIRMIRDQDDNLIRLGSQEYHNIVLVMRKAGVAVEDREGYDPDQGGGWGEGLEENPILGNFAQHGALIRAFDFQPRQWLDIAGGLRIKPSDLMRLIRWILPAPGARQVEWMVGNAYLIGYVREYDDGVSGSQKRRALIDLVTQCARKGALKKTFRLLKKINSSLGGRRLEMARMVLLAHALTGHSIDYIVQFLNDMPGWKDVEDNIIMLHAMVLAPQIEYLRQHYDTLEDWAGCDEMIEISRGSVYSYYGGSVCIGKHSGDPTDCREVHVVDLLTMADWARALRWRERNVENPEEELERWERVGGIHYPLYVRMLNDALMRVKATEGTQEWQRMWQVLEWTRANVDLNSVLYAIHRLDQLYGSAERLIDTIFSDRSMARISSMIIDYMLRFEDFSSLMRALNVIEDIRDLFAEYEHLDWDDIGGLVRFCTQSDSMVESMREILDVIHGPAVMPAVNKLCDCIQSNRLHCTPDHLLELLGEFGQVIESERDVWRFCAWLSWYMRDQGRRGSRRAALQLHHAALAAVV